MSFFADRRYHSYDLRTAEFRIEDCQIFHHMPTIQRRPARWEDLVRLRHSECMVLAITVAVHGLNTLLYLVKNGETVTFCVFLACFCCSWDRISTCLSLTARFLTVIRVRGLSLVQTERSLVAATILRNRFFACSLNYIIQFV